MSDSCRTFPEHTSPAIEVEIINAIDLAHRWKLNVSWVRNHSRSYSEDMIPHIRLGGSSATNGGVMHSLVTGIATAPDTASLPKRRYQRGSLLLKHGAWYAVVGTSPTSTSDDSRKQQWVRLGSLADFPHKDDIYPHYIRFMQLVNEEMGTTDDLPGC